MCLAWARVWCSSPTRARVWDTRALFCCSPLRAHIPVEHRIASLVGYSCQNTPTQGRDRCHPFVREPPLYIPIIPNHLGEIPLYSDHYSERKGEQNLFFSSQNLILERESSSSFWKLKGENLNHWFFSLRLLISIQIQAQGFYSKVKFSPYHPKKRYKSLISLGSRFLRGLNPRTSPPIHGVS